MREWTSKAARVGLAAVALAGGGCADGDDGGQSCRSASSYERVAKPFVEHYCVTCHSARSSDRRGAPVGVNFDDLAGLRARGDTVYAFVEGGVMPPPQFTDLPRPSASERDAFVAWLQCTGIADK